MNCIIIMQPTRYYNSPWHPRVTAPQARIFFGSRPYWEHPAVRDLLTVWRPPAGHTTVADSQSPHVLYLLNKSLNFLYFDCIIFRLKFPVDSAFFSGFLDENSGTAKFWVKISPIIDSVHPWSGYICVILTVPPMPSWLSRTRLGDLSASSQPTLLLHQ